jgi:alkylmercury lyase
MTSETEALQRNRVTFQAHLAEYRLDIIPHLVRLLADGEPVRVDRVAAASGWTAAEVRAELARHPGVDWDDDGRIAGFGLTLQPTPHTFTFDTSGSVDGPGDLGTTGRTVYAFCASDALTFPVILDLPGVVESTCPATGRRIRLELTPTEVVTVDPPTAVVSKLRPTEAVTDIRAEVCALGHIFSSAGAAADWLAAHPDGLVDTVADDFDIHRQTLLEIGWVTPPAGST